MVTHYFFSTTTLAVDCPAFKNIGTELRVQLREQCSCRKVNLSLDSCSHQVTRNAHLVPPVRKDIAQFIQQQVLRRIDQAANLAQPVSAPWEIDGLPGDNAGIGCCNDLGLRHRWYLKLQEWCLY
jgi:hypothetical protein